jgi:uncharacterized membrane protein YedE/YeeE
MLPLLGSLERRAALVADHAARRLFLGVLAAGLVLAGLGLLTTALWLALAEARGAVFAGVVCGGALLVLGLLVLLAGHALRPRAQLPPPAPDVSATELVAAFLNGLQAGRGGAPGPADSDPRRGEEAAGPRG